MSKIGKRVALKKYKNCYLIGFIVSLQAFDISIIANIDNREPRQYELDKLYKKLAKYYVLYNKDTGSIQESHLKLTFEEDALSEEELLLVQTKARLLGYNFKTEKEIRERIKALVKQQSLLYYEDE